MWILASAAFALPPDLEAGVVRYLEMDIVGLAEPADRDEEDRARLASVTAKRDAADALITALRAYAAVAPPEEAAQARLRAADVYNDLGRAIRESPVPTYLTEEQRQIYVMGLQDREFVARYKAREEVHAARAILLDAGLYCRVPPPDEPIVLTWGAPAPPEPCQEAFDRWRAAPVDGDQNSRLVGEKRGRDLSRPMNNSMC